MFTVFIEDGRSVYLKLLTTTSTSNGTCYKPSRIHGYAEIYQQTWLDLSRI